MALYLAIELGAPGPLKGLLRAVALGVEVHGVELGGQGRVVVRA